MPDFIVTEDTLILIGKHIVIKKKKKLEVAKCHEKNSIAIELWKFALGFVIREWFGLEGILGIILLKPSYCRQEHLPLDQVTQRPIQPVLNTCRERTAAASLGNLFHFLTTLAARNFFLTSV